MARLGRAARAASAVRSAVRARLPLTRVAPTQAARQEAAISSMASRARVSRIASAGAGKVLSVVTPSLVTFIVLPFFLHTALSDLSVSFKDMPPWEQVAVVLALSAIAAVAVWWVLRGVL